MRYFPTRRQLLIGAAFLPFVDGVWFGDTARAAGEASAQKRLKALEAASGGRLGVAARDTANGAMVNYRADERFAFCSTFKVVAVSAVLKRSAAETGLLERRIVYTKDDMVTYSPITEKHIDAGMTVAELCAAALQYSDNTAANLLLQLLGGPAAVTAFARAVGDDTFRLDRRETALNTAISGDLRDTTTPAAMTRTLRGLTLGDRLAAPERDRLVGWMRGNTTGATRIRAGVPSGWTVADKTGTGDYGTTNDIGVVWRPHKPPFVLSIYFTQHEKNAAAHSDVLAKTARIVAETFG